MFPDRGDSLLLNTVRSISLDCILRVSCIVLNRKYAGCIPDLILGQFLVGFKSVSGDGFVFLLDADELIRIYFFFLFIPKQQFSIKFITVQVSDIDIAP